MRNFLGILGAVFLGTVAFQQLRQPPLEADVRETLAGSEALAYLTEIGFGSEYGEAEAVVRKWHRSPLTLHISGTPTPEDRQVVSQVMAELTELTEIEWTDQPDADIVMRFLPEAQFSQVEPNYRPVNYGYFWVRWDGQTMTEASILISTTDITQAQRSHLIREELTQVFGLMRDSYRYPDSIFYQDWTETQEYAPIDREVIRMLYCPEVRHGMSASALRDALATEECQDWML